MGKDKKKDKPGIGFPGFDRPTQNWFKMPNQWTDITALMSTRSEILVVQYVLRHTWGYNEHGQKKCISVDEFVNGRRGRDGRRLDSGTGLSEGAVDDGIHQAVKDGFLEVEIDDSDKARIAKSYGLRLLPGDDTEVDTPQVSGGKLYPSEGQTLPPRGSNFTPRTEKDTKEKHLDTHRAGGFIAEVPKEQSPAEKWAAAAADKLWNAIGRKRDKRSRLNQWIAALTKFAAGEDLTEVAAVFDWYIAHIDDEYMVEVLSADAFVEKYNRILNRREKETRRKKRDPGPPSYEGMFPGMNAKGEVDGCDLTEWIRPDGTLNEAMAADELFFHHEKIRARAAGETPRLRPFNRDLEAIREKYGPTGTGLLKKGNVPRPATIAADGNAPASFWEGPD